jgi:hypothetical protein
MPLAALAVQDIDPNCMIAQAYHSEVSPDPGSGAARTGGL